MHVMLVADQPDEAARLREWLCTGLGPGCEVTHLESLNEALIQMQANLQVIDVLIVDLIIPPSRVQMAGLSLAQERAPAMAIIVVSELGDDDVVRTAIRSGAQEFVVKAGLDAERLAAIVNNVVTERRRMAEGMKGLQTPNATIMQQAVVLCELSPLAVELLARKAREQGKSTQQTLEDLIRESFAPPNGAP
jgi:DNA-binding NtrC family response regulator